MDSVYLQHAPEAVAEQGGREAQPLRAEPAQIWSCRSMEGSAGLGERGFPVLGAILHSTPSTHLCRWGQVKSQQEKGKGRGATSYPCLL